MSAWRFVIAVLPGGARGMCCWESMTITLAPGQLQVERRSTIAHELVHAERGAFPEHRRALEERQVSAAAARRLIEIHALGEALAWSMDAAEVADELWVDVPTLRSRMDHLHPAERHYLKRRLADDGE